MALVLDKRLILCCCAFSIIPVANAATVNGTFQVLMTIQKACTVTARFGFKYHAWAGEYHGNKYQCKQHDFD